MSIAICRKWWERRFCVVICLVFDKDYNGKTLLSKQLRNNGFYCETFHATIFTWTGPYYFFIAWGLSQLRVRIICIFKNRIIFRVFLENYILQIWRFYFVRQKYKLKIQIQNSSFYTARLQILLLASSHQSELFSSSTNHNAFICLINQFGAHILRSDDFPWIVPEEMLWKMNPLLHAIFKFCTAKRLFVKRLLMYWV